MTLFLKEWVLNIMTVSIILVLIEILAPTGKSKKIINLIAGLILILTIVQPFFKVLFNGVDFEQIYAQSNNYSQAIFEKTGDIGINTNTLEEFDGKELKEKQVAQITYIYRNRIVDKIKNLIVEGDNFQDIKVDIIINEDYRSENYGEIKKIYITAYLLKEISKEGGLKNKFNIDIGKIEEVKIGQKFFNNTNNINTENNNNSNDDNNNINVSENNDPYYNTNNAKIIKKLEDKISSTLGVEKNNIIITIK